MKKNFVISHIKDLWIKGVDELFIIDPYVYYLIKDNNDIENYRSIDVAEYIRNTPEAMQEAVDFVEEKYQKYAPLLAKRLNHIHNTAYSEFFWKKSLSTALTRYITLFHDIFAKCEKYFNEDIYECQILSQKSFYTPLDFEDHRAVFQATIFGQEQIFSHYINLFYPNKFNEVDLKPEDYGCDFVPGIAKLKLEKKTYDFKHDIKTLKRKIFAIFSKKYRQKLVKHIVPQNLKIGILGSFFSGENISKLFKESDGKIAEIEIDTFTQKLIDTPIDFKKRKLLGLFEDDFDKFDKFFFSTLPYCLPRAFIENFEAIKKRSIAKIKKYPDLKYITSEAWLSDTYISMELAFMRESGIKHIYNEHNAILYPFMGKMVDNITELVDYYVSFGWETKKYKNFISGASLFPFAIPETHKKKYQILYVSYTLETKMSNYGGVYGLMDVNVPKQLDFIETFMKNIKIDILKKMFYRGYPKDYCIRYMAYDKENILQEFLQYMHMTQAIYEKGETCKEQMLKSRLVIVDYVSTAYLEALIMNIPVVFFFLPQANYLKEEYSDCYNVLIDAGICQTDPVKAAEFIEKIADNPETWWFSEDVQNARNIFLNKNFKKPQVMIDYLLSLAKE